jgi:hypothetical protein
VPDAILVKQDPSGSLSRLAGQVPMFLQIAGDKEEALRDASTLLLFIDF